MSRFRGVEGDPVNRWQQKSAELSETAFREETAASHRDAAFAAFAAAINSEPGEMELYMSRRDLHLEMAKRETGWACGRGKR
jgi:hypothetical protein